MATYCSSICVLHSAILFSGE